jgi:hypothetical protein
MMKANEGDEEIQKEGYKGLYIKWEKKILKKKN